MIRRCREEFGSQATAFKIKLQSRAKETGRIDQQQTSLVSSQDENHAASPALPAPRLLV